MEWTREQLLHLFEYIPEYGVLLWKNPPKETIRGVKKGNVAGMLIKKRPMSIRMPNDKLCAVSRIIWFLEKNEWPPLLAYKNKNFHDSRIENLEIFVQEGHRFTKKKGKESPVGTSFVKSKNKWVASIFLNGKSKNLGYFNTSEEAHEAYLKALKEYKKTLRVLF